MPQSLQKLLIYLALALFLVFAGYHLMNLEPVQQAPLAENGSSEMEGQDIVNLVDKLKKVSIDKSIFSSPVYSSLVDYTVNLYAELQGRPNPFANIGGENMASVQMNLGGTGKMQGSR